MLHDRIDIINKITRTLSLLMCDIKLHQSMNDFSVNIHAEDFFRDLLNNLSVNNHFVNANVSGKNAAYIDLVDHTNKRVIQVTSTSTKQKIDNSLKILDNPDYIGYTLEILYLLEKPTTFQNNSENEFKEKYGIADIHKHLMDSSDLLGEIKCLTDIQIVELYKNIFASVEEKYTDEIALQVVFDLLLKEKRTKRINYDDDLGTTETDAKLKINNINNRITSNINMALDYTQSVYNLDENNQIDDLRSLVVDDYYAKILKDNLRRHESFKKLNQMKVNELHELAKKSEICFNKVLYNLGEKIENATFNLDFNSNSVSWVIVTYFFELCDVGIKE